MRSFNFQIATDPASAIRALLQDGGHPRAQFLAGGTTLIDLMKLDVLHPVSLVDINVLESTLGDIEATPVGVKLGAMARMADVAEHPDIKRDYPLIAQSLQLAASPQIRNMASLGGNVLQKTRCTYFRDPTWVACSKRSPGSGCSALTGVNRRHAILGTSESCIASYPGDFANALIALDGRVTLLGPSGSRSISFDQLHRQPGDTPHIETTLQAGELITSFEIPSGPWTRRSFFLKVRERASYDFALASAAVALHIDGGIVKTARIALGGVATKPWRSPQAEFALTGMPMDEAAASNAARIAFAGAVTRRGNEFKLELGRRMLVRALLQAAAMEV